MVVWGLVRVDRDSICRGIALFFSFLSLPACSHLGQPRDDEFYTAQKIKIERFVRSNLLAKKDDTSNLSRRSLEAWRHIQLARRLRLISANEWRDYERLALYYVGACPLSLSETDAKREHLLNAAVYRLNSGLFLTSSTLIAPGSGEDRFNSNLAIGQVPYLNDISSAEVLRGEGCRLTKLLLRKRAGIEQAELQELMKFLRLQGHFENEELPDRERFLVLIRAIDLVSRIEPRNQILYKQLVDQLPSPDRVHWLDLPDQERMWLFVKLFGGKDLSQVAEEKRSQAESIAKRIISAPDSSSRWLAMINLDFLRPETRLELLGKVEKKGSFSERAWVLYQLALTYHELGRTNAALTVLRRLLVEREEEVREDLDEGLVDLATRIFAGHQLDERTEAALETSLPSRLWANLIEKSMVIAAIEGRRSTFAQLEKRMKSSHSRHANPFFQPLVIELARALSKREPKTFQRLLNGTGKSGAERETLIFAQVLATALGNFDQTRAYAGLRPYFRALARFLEQAGPPGTERHDEVADLVHLFETLGLPDEQADSAQKKGAVGHSLDREKVSAQRSVRKGLIDAGVARWKSKPIASAKFLLDPPAVMPQRDLFFVPDPDSPSAWKFSVTKR